MSSFAPNTTPVDQDDSDFEDEGWKSSARVAQQFEATASINVKKDATGSAVNAVHARLLAAHEAMGEAAKVRIRYYDREGLEDARIVTCLVTWEWDGEGTEDLGSASLTFTGCGAPVSEANPNAPVGP